MRIETEFRYPEGSYVDLFVVDEGLLPPIKVSGLGQTMGWLLDVQVRPWLSKKCQSLLTEAIKTHGVRQSGGALELGLSSLDELSQGIVRLGQACLRVADLIYTRRSSLAVPVVDEVEEVLADAALSYDVGAELEGRFSTKVCLDFLVRGMKTRSGLLTWSSPNTSSANAQANEIFRRWYDLDLPTRDEQRVTILDDRFDTYRDEDLQRLRDKSIVLPLSEREGIAQVLAA